MVFLKCFFGSKKCWNVELDLCQCMFAFSFLAIRFLPPSLLPPKTSSFQDYNLSPSLSFILNFFLLRSYQCLHLLVTYPPPHPTPRFRQNSRRRGKKCPPNHQRWYAKRKLGRNIHTLHTRFCTLGADLHAQSVLINKISASELSRKFVKSALLVGRAFIPRQGRKQNILFTFGLRRPVPHSVLPSPSFLPPNVPTMITDHLLEISFWERAEEKNKK